MKKTEAQTVLLVSKAGGPIIRKNLLDHYWEEDDIELPLEINYRSGNGLNSEATVVYLDDGEDEQVNSYGYQRYLHYFSFGGPKGTAIYLHEDWIEKDTSVSSTNMIRLMNQLLLYIKDFVLLEVISQSIDAQDSQIVFDKLSDFFSFPRWPAPERRPIHNLTDALDEVMEGDKQANADYNLKSPADEPEFLCDEPDPEPETPKRPKRPKLRTLADRERDLGITKRRGDYKLTKQEQLEEDERGDE